MINTFYNRGNTLPHKQFSGGHISIVGANSPAGLASRPVRVVLCDEVDRYPVSAGSEGDPVPLKHESGVRLLFARLVLIAMV